MLILTEIYAVLSFGVDNIITLRLEDVNIDGNLYSTPYE